MSFRVRHSPRAVISKAHKADTIGREAPGVGTYRDEHPQTFEFKKRLSLRAKLEFPTKTVFPKSTRFSELKHKSILDKNVPHFY